MQGTVDGFKVKRCFFSLAALLSKRNNRQRHHVDPAQRNLIHILFIFSKTARLIIFKTGQIKAADGAEQISIKGSSTFAPPSPQAKLTCVQFKTYKKNKFL